MRLGFLSSIMAITIIHWSTCFKNLVIYAAERSANLVEEWFLTPWRLTRACRTQGIPGFSIFGIKASKLAEELTSNLLNNAKKHGETYYVRFGKFVRLVVLDPIMIQEIIVENADCYKKPSFITALDILGNGIFSASGRDWVIQRQLLAKSFIMKELKEYFEAIKQCSENDVGNWNLLETETVDIHKRFLSLTVKLICHIVFDQNIQRDSASNIYEGFNHYLQNCRDMLCSRMFNFFGCRWKSKQTLGSEVQILEMIKQIISERKQRMLSLDEDAQKLKIVDLMINAVREREDFSEKMAMDNSMTLLLAGHETTANLLTWTTYLLAINPEWQRKARDEVQRLGDLELKKVSEMKTISLILWESLRLFPPQPLIGRLCERENIVKGLLIPEKIEVIASISALHRDTRIWGHDAEEFKPERFANGINKACKTPLAFLPFGSGPRTCIGQSLALLEARVILYFMLKMYSWTLSPAYQHCPDITLTLQPRLGMPIILTRMLSLKEMEF